MNLAPRCVTRSLATCPGVHERANKGITKGSVRCRGVFGQVKACLVGGSDWKDCSLRLFTAPFGRSCSGGYPLVTNAVFFLFHCPPTPQKSVKTCRIKRICSLFNILHRRRIAPASGGFPHRGTPPRAACSGPCRAAHTPNPPAPTLRHLSRLKMRSQQFYVEPVFLFYCPLIPRNPASALISHVSHPSKKCQNVSN